MKKRGTERRRKERKTNGPRKRKFNRTLMRKRGTTSIAYKYIAESQSEAEHTKDTIGVCHGRYSASSSLSSLVALRNPDPDPPGFELRALGVSTNTLVAPSDPFFCLVLARRFRLDDRECRVGGSADLERELVALRETLLVV